MPSVVVTGCRIHVLLSADRHPPQVGNLVARSDQAPPWSGPAARAARNWGPCVTDPDRHLPQDAGWHGSRPDRRAERSAGRARRAHPGLARRAHGLPPAAGAELAGAPPDVGLARALTGVELGGDLAVGHPPGHQPRALELAVGGAVEPGHAPPI